MIEIRRFHKLGHIEYHEFHTSNIPGETVLQYRECISDIPSSQPWTSWRDVPDVYEKETEEEL